MVPSSKEPTSCRGSSSSRLGSRRCSSTEWHNTRLRGTSHTMQPNSQGLATCPVMWANSQHDTRTMLLYFVVSRRSQPARPPHSIASSHNCVLFVLLSEHRSCLNPPISAEPSASLASVSSLWSCSNHQFYPILGPLTTKQHNLFLSSYNGWLSSFSPRDALFRLLLTSHPLIIHSRGVVCSLSPWRQALCLLGCVTQLLLF